MSYVYWTITSQYSIINDPITGFVNTSRFTTLDARFFKMQMVYSSTVAIRIFHSGWLGNKKIRRNNITKQQIE